MTNLLTHLVVIAVTWHVVDGQLVKLVAAVRGWGYA